jgi:hypothetical protein
MHEKSQIVEYDFNIHKKLRSGRTIRPENDDKATHHDKKDRMCENNHRKVTLFTHENLAPHILNACISFKQQQLQSYVIKLGR